MKDRIPAEIIAIYNKFQKSGFEIYLVGGCVRNLMLEKEIKDWDFTTDAKPEEILKLFKDGFYDNKFGTVGLPAEALAKAGIPIKDPEFKNQVIEITTFRTEHGYSDRRRPDTVEWGKTIEEDLARRDFTVNAIALRFEPSVIANPSLPRGKQSKVDGIATSSLDPLRSEASKLGTPRNDNKSIIIDPFGGQKDIQDKIIRAVGDPSQRFKEDALRLIRAIRIATEHAFTIEEKTWNEIAKDSSLIKDVSGERIRVELLRILGSVHPYEGVMLLKNSGILQHILPQLMEGIGVSQARPGRHHTTDVFTHNVLSLKFCPSTDPIVRFATLLHDVGKPKVEKKDEHGLVIFHNHEIVGGKIVREICDRLRFSRKDRDKIVNLIRWHMFTVDEKITDSAVRRFIRRVGVESVKDMMDLRIGDRLGGGTQTAESWRLKLFKNRIEDQLKPAPFSINDLAIDGNDIMKELNIKPGPKVGQILQKIFEEVDEDLSKNNNDYLLKRIKEVA